MTDLLAVMGREMLHSEHAARCFLEAKRRDHKRAKSRCSRCGAEGFRLTDGLCDGCHEAASQEVPQ